MTAELTFPGKCYFLNTLSIPQTKTDWPQSWPAYLVCWFTRVIYHWSVPSPIKHRDSTSAAWSAYPGRLSQERGNNWTAVRTYIQWQRWLWWQDLTEIFSRMCRSAFAPSPPLSRVCVWACLLHHTHGMTALNKNVRILFWYASLALFIGSCMAASIGIRSIEVLLLKNI